MNAKNYVLILIGLMILLPVFVSADEITVGIKPAPPFVIVENDSISGFSIDLIEKIVDDIGNTTIKYKIDTDLTTHFKSIKNKDVDFGIAATTITADREKLFDFSYPFFNAPIGILIDKSDNNTNIFDLILNKNVLYIIIAILLYTVICGHIIWFIEKGDGDFDKHYLKGVFKGMWWTIVTMSTVGYGDFFPKRVLGRVFGSFVIISGITLFGLAIATLGSTMTLSELKPSIAGPTDLLGQPVAVIANTNSVEIAQEYGMNTVIVNDLDNALNLVRLGNAKAVVYDEPILKYYINNDLSKEFIMAQETFHPSYYGIVFRNDSIWINRVNVALLNLIENGEYNKLKKEWFG